MLVTQLCNGELYVAYHSIDSYVKVRFNNGNVVTLGKVPVTPFVKYVNSILYVNYNMVTGNQPIFKVNAYDPYTSEQYSSVLLD